MKRKYNSTLFWLGFLLNIVRLFWIGIPAVILLMIGIWVRPCLYIGSALLLVLLLVALVQQLQIKKMAETDNDPAFAPFAEAMCSDNWREQIVSMVNEKIDAQRNEGPDSDPSEKSDEKNKNSSQAD